MIEVLADKYPPLMDPVLCTDCRGVFEPYAQTPAPSRSNAIKRSLRRLQGSLGSLPIPLE